MLRSHQKLAEAATTPTALTSDEARDRLYNFFRDAYQLKDWVKNDPMTNAAATTHPKLERSRSSQPLRGLRFRHR
ncbi:hypothetical protein ACFY19_15455 [Streptosporangium saharense]|uniref:hypothetical protein n=1 Tax=Streptosporangium saharense TaxID=1706840 RepID=UPI0036BFB265